MSSTCACCEHIFCSARVSKWNHVKHEHVHSPVPLNATLTTTFYIHGIASYHLAFNYTGGVKGRTWAHLKAYFKTSSIFLLEIAASPCFPLVSHTLVRASLHVIPWQSRVLSKLLITCRKIACNSSPFTSSFVFSQEENLIHFMSRQAALAVLKEFSPDVWIRKWFIVHLNEESRSLYTKDGENRETMMSESSQQTTSVIVKWGVLHFWWAKGKQLKRIQSAFLK